MERYDVAFSYSDESIHNAFHSSWDGLYVVFGIVVSGFDVVKAIQKKVSCFISDEILTGFVSPLQGDQSFIDY